jgi:hypothetical protein
MEIDESGTVLTVLVYGITNIFLSVSQERLVSSLFQDIHLP